MAIFFNFTFSQTKQMLTSGMRLRASAWDEWWLGGGEGHYISAKSAWQHLAHPSGQVKKKRGGGGICGSGRPSPACWTEVHREGVRRDRRGGAWKMQGGRETRQSKQARVF